MKSEDKIRKVVEYLEKQYLYCRVCKVVKPRMFYDGDLECDQCKTLLDGTWFEYGVYIALKWVLGDISDEEFSEKIDLE
ncbi:MAG: hypothetical protein DRJ60_03205 [Thermoprotei archaeon]|nr:MAG: hypothetical protein DRJ60_03205 [Thermoprotei archaeon]